MRISVNETPPKGIDIFDYEVYFNNKKLKNCVTADEEQGKVYVIVNSFEEFILCHPKAEILCGKYDEYKIGVLHGKVELRKIGEI